MAPGQEGAMCEVKYYTKTYSVQPRQQADSNADYKTTLTVVT